MKQLPKRLRYEMHIYTQVTVDALLQEMFLSVYI